jgi:hypothetical protein
MSTIPLTLNWVEKRAACTVATVFNQICDGVGNDVAEFNSVSSLSEENQFRADLSQAGNGIAIGQPMRIPRKRVIIRADQSEIVVIQEWSGGEQWAATVGLNDEGRCTLRLKDQTEIEQWQFRKRALEALFFGK